MKKMRVYLSGAMESAADDGEGWRENAKTYAQSLAHVSLICPRAFNKSIDDENPGWRDDKDHRKKKYMDTIRTIIKRDMNALLACDFCLVMWDENAPVSVGTHAELSSSFLAGRRVITVLPGGTRGDKINNLPAWVIGCTEKYFPSVNNALDWIHEEAVETKTAPRDKIKNR